MKRFIINYLLTNLALISFGLVVYAIQYVLGLALDSNQSWRIAFVSQILAVVIALIITEKTEEVAEEKKYKRKYGVRWPYNKPEDSGTLQIRKTFRRSKIDSMSKTTINNIITQYKDGIHTQRICEDNSISTGMLYIILNKYGAIKHGRGNNRSSKTPSNLYEDIANDYKKGMKLNMIKTKYGFTNEQRIYYVLDKLGVKKNRYFK